MIESINDIKSCMDKLQAQNNKIKAIWIRGHGNENGITLNKDSSLTNDNLHELISHFNRIDPNGYIILDACLTAGKTPLIPLILLKTGLIDTRKNSDWSFTTHLFQ
ncbi:MAG: hypothetical protein HWD61_01355 [Parachlamydiaceae bacterium]|nr:MAG: hypothetical protein HWD61_01355 [Parachlamydiaceae bacterium]